MISALWLFVAASAAGAPPGKIESPEQVPQELRAFVEPGTLAIWVSAADLDRDGDSDYVLVLERKPTEVTDDDPLQRQRSLLLVTREQDGRLRVVKRNSRIIMCPTCSATGDPFVEVEAARGSFTVYHYGGDRWRWGTSYRFDYSRRDRSWQLVEVSTLTFDAVEWEDGKSEHEERFVPPKDFGKIDIADFNPDKWEGPIER